MPIRRLNCAKSATHSVTHPEGLPGDELLQATLWLMGFGQSTLRVTPLSLDAFVRHHGVAGLLDKARLEGLDGPHANALNREQQRIALRALQLGGALKTLMSAFAACGLQPLALKGPALAIQAHGSLGARGGVDLDILLDEAQWPLAIDVLQRLEYTPAPGQSLPLPRGTHELVLLHRTRPRVELHRRLLRQQHLLPYSTGMAMNIDLQGSPIATLDPVYALPYLIAHANQHCFRRLIWLTDIHALLQRPDLSMQRVAEQINLTGTRAMLDTCLTLLEHLFGTPIPSHLQAVRRPCRASRAMVEVALVAIRKSLSDDEVAAHLGPLKRVTLDIALQDSLNGRWQALSGWLSPTGKDSNWLVLPQSLAFFYPFVRLYRLIIKAR